MAGKNTRKNKGPIGRKQHRTLRNKRQMRGGTFTWSKSTDKPLSRLDKLELRVDDIDRPLKKAERNIIVINKHLQIDAEQIDSMFVDDYRFNSARNSFLTIATKINRLEEGIKQLQKKIDPNNNQESK